jgi:hypothetical protein
MMLQNITETVESFQLIFNKEQINTTAEATKLICWEVSKWM